MLFVNLMDGSDLDDACISKRGIAVDSKGQDDIVFLNELIGKIYCLL